MWRLTARILKAVVTSETCTFGPTSSIIRHVHLFKRNYGRVSDLSCASEKDVSYLSSPKYWDGFYQKNSSTFEWLVTYEDVKDHLYHILHDKAKYKHLLDLGCGSSTLGASIMKNLLPDAQGTFYDISPPSLRIQTAIHWEFNLANRCRCIQGSVLCLPFQSESFDVVIDKGTMDSLFKAKENTEANAITMLREICRVLSPGGLYLQISDEDPDSRLDFLTKNWTNHQSNFKSMEVNNREMFLYTLYK